MSPNGLRTSLRCERGAAAVEFAIVSLLLILFFVMAFELGRAFYVLNGMGYAVDFGMRKILLDPAVAPGDVETEIRSRFNAGDKALLTVTAPLGTTRTITVTYPLTFMAPFVEASKTLTVQRTMSR